MLPDCTIKGAALTLIRLLMEGRGFKSGDAGGGATVFYSLVTDEPDDDGETLAMTVTVREDKTLADDEEVSTDVAEFKLTIVHTDL